MSKKKTVTVSLKDGALGLASSFFNGSGELVLEPGDWVEWDFKGMPSDTLPVIKFDDSAAPFGPFQCLQSKPGGTVQGKGNVGMAGEHSYTAMLLDTCGVRASSWDPQKPPHKVRNSSQDRNASPIVAVTVTATPGGPPLLEFDPETSLKLYPGDTALWDVTGLASGQFVSFLFEPPSGDPDLDPLVGPFESLLAYRKVENQGPDVMRIVAANFKPKTNDISQYTYNVAVRDSEGNILTQHEPIIDNLGQPPG